MRKTRDTMRKKQTRATLIYHLGMVQSITKASDYRPEDKERNICMQFGWICGYYAGKGFSEYKYHLCYEYINKCLDKVNQERKERLSK